MAAQPACPPPAPSAQVVGNAFVEQYYHILHQSPELVYRFYQDTSLLSRPDPNGLMTTVTTMKGINDKICSLDYKNYKAEIKTADAQGSHEDGVIVLVTGCLTGKGKDNKRRKFTQTFFLAPQEKGYYVLNDVFRYVEENEPEPETSGTLVIGAYEIPTTSMDSNPEPIQVVDSPSENRESLQLEEVENIEEPTDEQLTDEGHDADNLVTADSHLNENHVSEVLESASSPQEDTPKKSYASIVSSLTKKGPTKIYVPANTAKVVPAKAETRPLNSAAEMPGSESSAPIAPDNASDSKDTQDEVEGHSIYVRNLPPNVTVSQLEAEFQKFGAIKPNGVQVRSNMQGFCFGFVEFRDIGSMQKAIKASPITISDRQAAVEIKRTTTRVGSGRGRFSSSRGGFRNDSFRGRGNFNGGRTYVRSDSFRGRGNYSGGRGGDGFHQHGRWRGVRRASPSQNSSST